MDYGKTGENGYELFYPDDGNIKENSGKYKNETLKDGKLISVKVRHTVNRHLKEIAEVCSIKKHLTFHHSRHTFATLTK